MTLKWRPSALQAPLESKTASFSVEKLKEINDAMLSYPEGFHILKLNKVLEKRREPFEKEEGLVDWAQAEQLAFATILQDGTSIRLTDKIVSVVRSVIAMLYYMMKKLETHTRHYIMCHIKRRHLKSIIRHFLKQQ